MRDLAELIGILIGLAILLVIVFFLITVVPALIGLCIVIITSLFTDVGDLGYLSYVAIGFGVLILGWIFK